ncbi:MAG: hypothetical protein ABUL71_05725 [Gemmatimonadota bacterium]
MTTLLLLPGALAAQDTTQAYPWRLSYFPYLTASPNDGVMAMGRVLFFRQSRWDDRVSLHSGVAIEGGYSTKESWLARVRGDLPRIAPGWRVQVIGQAERTPDYFPDQPLSRRFGATRQFGAAEVTRSLGGPVHVAVRGEVSHVHVTSGPDTLPYGLVFDMHETDVRARVAIVVDQRDREFDTRSGTLLEGGFFVGSPTGNAGTSSYHGEFAVAAGWMPITERTRFTVRGAAQFSRSLGLDASREIPGWEGDIPILGGFASNRALPIGARTDDCTYLVGAELRHDIKTFPGGALAVLAFVDGGRVDDCGAHAVTVALRAQRAMGAATNIDAWTWGPGAGISLRLLRNAILTATIARGDGATRVYVGSGWSW